MGSGNVCAQLVHGEADRDLLRVVLRGDEGPEPGGLDRADAGDVVP